MPAAGVGAAGGELVNLMRHAVPYTRGAARKESRAVSDGGNERIARNGVGSPKNGECTLPYAPRVIAIMNNDCRTWQDMTIVTIWLLPDLGSGR